MGITGLLPLLGGLITPQHVQAYRGRKVAVDTYCWLHRGIHACSRDLVLGIPTKEHLEYSLSMVEMLQHFGVVPVMVFDGGPLPSKAGTERQRRAQREQHRATARRLEASGHSVASEAVRDAYNKAAEVTPAMAAELIAVLRRRGIQCIVAPYEADAQLAYLARSGDVYAVITEDSDMLVYACPRVLFKMDRYGHGQEAVLASLAQAPTCVPRPKVDVHALSPDQLRWMCILAGCDYAPGAPGVGLITAYSLVLRRASIDSVLDALRKKKPEMTHPETFSEFRRNFLRADATFRHQRVYCPKKQDVITLTPLSDAVQQLMQQENVEFIGPAIQQPIARRIAVGEVSPNPPYQPLVPSQQRKNQLQQMRGRFDADRANRDGKMPLPAGTVSLARWLKPRGAPAITSSPECADPADQQTLSRSDAAFQAPRPASAASAGLARSQSCPVLGGRKRRLATTKLTQSKYFRTDSSVGCTSVRQQQPEIGGDNNASTDRGDVSGGGDGGDSDGDDDDEDDRMRVDHGNQRHRLLDRFAHRKDRRRAVASPFIGARRLTLTRASPQAPTVPVRSAAMLDRFVRRQSSGSDGASSAGSTSTGSTSLLSTPRSPSFVYRRRQQSASQ